MSDGGMTLQALGEGEFALRLVSRQRVAPLYWRSRTHTHTHAPAYFWHRTRGFLEARCSWESGSRLTTGFLSPFRLSPKFSLVNIHWAITNHTFLTHKNPQADTFLHDISPAKLRSTARVRHPKEISKLMNKVDCWVPCVFSQSDSAGLPHYKILRSGILSVPLPYGMHLKVSPKGHHIFV